MEQNSRTFKIEYSFEPLWNIPPVSEMPLANIQENWLALLSCFSFSFLSMEDAYSPYSNYSFIHFE